MELRRVDKLPPYTFGIVEASKSEALQKGLEVFDFGFGNPDLPSPEEAVDELRESAVDPASHRYSVSRGIGTLRAAFSRRYQERFGVTVDPDTEVVATMGSKEGLHHLMWVLVESGDSVLVPDPSYPIHGFSPQLAGGQAVFVPIDQDDKEGSRFLESLESSYCRVRPKPRAVIVSFPHNPTTLAVGFDFFKELVDWARFRDVVIIHDFAYCDTYFTEEQPPSILQVPNAKEVAVELVSLTKSHSMAGWRIGAAVGNSELLSALARLKSYLDYGSFRPIQLAAATALLEAGSYVQYLNARYMERARALVDGLNEIGWHTRFPLGTMFVWTRIPEKFAGLSSLEFSRWLTLNAGVVVSPGEGFGANGEGWVRFALIEPPERIGRAVEALGRVLSS
jgi:alanine-synthesizing transaminase